jgi:hypothetical protein
MSTDLIPKRPFSLRVIKEEAISAGITPLEFMLNILRAPMLEKRKGEGPDDFESRVFKDLQFRLDAAKAAAPYLHARIATQVVIQPPPDQEKKPIDILELAKDVAFILAVAESKQSQKQLQ